MIDYCAQGACRDAAPIHQPKPANNPPIKARYRVRLLKDLCTNPKDTIPQYDQ